MNVAISTSCFYPLETEYALMKIGKNHVNCAEIFVNTFAEIEMDFLKQIRDTMDFYNIEVPSFHPFSSGFEPCMLFTSYLRRFEDGLKWYRKYFEAMNILDSKIFVFHGDREQGLLEKEEYFERFARLRDVGKEYGVIVAQENVSRCKSRSVDFLEEMGKYLDGDLSIVFDNKQAVRSGVSYKEFIDRLHQYIVHVHISDNNGDDDCLPIGKGSLNMLDFFSRLLIFGYKGNATIELYGSSLENTDAIFESYKTLKEKLKLGDIMT